MKSSAGLMILFLMLAVSAIGGLWFYLSPGKAKDLVGQASSDLVSIDSQLNLLENAAARLNVTSNAPASGPVTQEKLDVFQTGGKAEMVMDSLDRQKCKDILQRMLSHGRNVRLNGQPVKSEQGCRSANNRIEVLM
jgi:hypothetical protein